MNSIPKLPTLGDPSGMCGIAWKGNGVRGVSANNLGSWINQNNFTFNSNVVVLVDCREKFQASSPSNASTAQFKGAIHIPLNESIGRADTQVISKALYTHQTGSPTTWSKLRQARLVIFYCNAGENRSVGCVNAYLSMPKERKDQEIAIVNGGISTLTEFTGCTEARGKRQQGEADLPQTEKPVLGPVFVPGQQSPKK